jgi:hypothetical protein
MMKVTDSGHAARLQRLASPALIEALGRALVASADSIAEDAAESIRADSISGPGHIPSQPGQPPNADTHDLDESIHVGELIDTGDGLQTHVIADSDHALYMEMGTSRVEARPFLMPAMYLGRRGTLERIAAAYNRYIRNIMEQ